MLKLFVDGESEIWQDRNQSSLHATGANNLIQQPEFADREKLSNVMKALEEKKELIEFINSKSIGEGIVITIGSENKMDQMQNCSVVASKYRAGNVSGTIGIIGPTRMPYSRLISIVEYTAKSLTKALSGS